MVIHGISEFMEAKKDKREMHQCQQMLCFSCQKIYLILAEL
nr:unnamed protein product [Callosobruchus analis]